MKISDIRLPGILVISSVIFSLIFGLGNSALDARVQRIEGPPYTNRENIPLPVVLEPEISPLLGGYFPSNLIDEHVPFLAQMVANAQWSYGQTQSQPGINSVIPKVHLSLRPLDLTRPPTDEEIMAAGQLGGQLYPTHGIEDKERSRKIKVF